MGVFLFYTSAQACLWDSDTLRQEAKGMPGVLEIGVGQLDRYPDLYYEMRLARVEKILKEDPNNLDALDDAAVAHDRLGRPSQALAYMELKKQALVPMGNPEDHRYRLHANIGTFYVHRWLKNGADYENMTDVIAAGEHIEEALRINPEAHFNRERYQLMFVQYLLEKPIDSPWRIWLSNNLKFEDISETEDAVKGLSGLIVLGAAWRSPDVYDALASLLERRGDRLLADIVFLRVVDLLNEGENFVMSSNTWKDTYIQRFQDYRASSEYEVLSIESNKTFYEKAKEKTDQVRVARSEYFLKQLKEGRHPDTHSKFFRGAPKWPKLKPPGLVTARMVFVLVGLALTALAIIALFLWLLRKTWRWLVSRKPSS